MSLPAVAKAPPSDRQPIAAPSQWCDADGCLPDVMILGTQKAATSALFKLLEREEFACPTARKEEHFFDAPRNFGADNVTAAPGRLAAYRHLFDPSKCAQRGAGVHFVDATPNYLSRPFVAPRIAAAYPPSLLPQLRLLGVVRGLQRRVPHQQLVALVLALRVGLHPRPVQDLLDLDKQRVPR